MDLVLVESPAKAKTINKYLGKGYEVLASFGHVRDLPAKTGSVEPDADFRMHWEVDPKAQKRLNEIARAVKDADKLIGLESRHFKDQCVEPIAPCDLGKLLRQRGNVLRRLIRRFLARRRVHFGP